MVKQWYKNKTVVILLHVVAWTIFFFVPYFLRPEVPGFKNIPIVRFLGWNSIIQYIFLAIVFYFNAYWLVPQLLNKRKYLLYLTSVILILATSFYVEGWRRKTIPQELREQVLMKARGGGQMPEHRVLLKRPPVFPALFTVIFILAVSVAYRFFLDKLHAEKVQQERETEHLKSELSFLRSQISPHFIFNVLNSAVSLARIHPAQVEPTLIKLSGLMRYMLYDTEDTKVPLNQEVDYLEAYVDLQKLRFGDLVQIVFTKSGSLFGFAIEPMLLIPFVENAFKHGLGRIDKPFIDINLKEDHGELYFKVRNRYNPDQLIKKDKYSGIGLANVKKRLDILYRDNYTLSTTVHNDWYETILKIPLQ